MDETRQIPVPALSSCREEQAWNRRKLCGTVRAPDLRWWTYRAPGVVLGCSQRAHLDLAHADIELIARDAGGGAVLVGPWMLSASIVLPASHALCTGSLAGSYRWLGESCAAALRGLGIGAHAISPEQARELQHCAAPPAIDWASYGGFSPWEVVVGRRKIVGLAQVRKRTGVLLVAGLLLDRPHWPLLTQAMNRSSNEAVLLTGCTTRFICRRGCCGCCRKRKCSRSVPTSRWRST